MLLQVTSPPICYAMLVLACRKAGPARLRGVLHLKFYHNILLALYSTYVAFASFKKLETVGRLDIWENGWRPLLCEASEGAPLLWYASKWWEWFDTVILYATGRTPGALHLGHHASTAPLVALNLVGRARPTPVFDAATALNGVVHVNMYAYYAAPMNFRPPWSWITMTQIAQHVVVLTMITTALSLDNCDAPIVPYGVALILYAYYLLMFARFYMKRWSAEATKYSKD